MIFPIMTLLAAAMLLGALMGQSVWGDVGVVVGGVLGLVAIPSVCAAIFFLDLLEQKIRAHKLREE